MSDFLIHHLLIDSSSPVGFEQAIENWRQTDEATPSPEQQSHTDALVLAVAAGAMDQYGHFGNQAADTNNAQASHAGIDDDPTLFDPPPTLSPHAQHLPALMRLVWRAVLLWGGLIALVTITNWVS